ncbi:hypothetical protein FPV67DRAFT_1559334 [Lyophyllum atratum]|nr:hypothetical protein FPV67DRAFT_1559334 [Lyophyllum atratum]
MFQCDHESCGREFLTMGALNYHKRACLPSRKRLRDVLTVAKELFEGRKKARTVHSVAQAIPSDSNNGDSVVLKNGRTESDLHKDNLPLSLRKSKRENIQKPARFRDDIPQPSPPFELKTFTTAINTFGIFRKIRGRHLPVRDPEEDRTLQNLSDIPVDEGSHSTPPKGESPFFPYPNRSSFVLGDWYWNHGTQKTLADFRMLVDIIKHPDFQVDDIRNTHWSNVNATLASNVGDNGDNLQAEWLDVDEGWQKTPISINVPFHKRTENRGVTESYVVGELYHRSILSVLKERLTDNRTPEPIYYEPYELWWQPDGNSEAVRVYGELYTSQAFLDSYEALLKSPPEPGCDAPRTIVGLMFWSDATHLTSFGQASLWPAYMFMGNNSKYDRCRPSASLANHIAYFQKLPASFKDFATKRFGGSGPTRDLVAHCNRETFHAQWEILLDDDFLTAWRHGILIQCGDGITHRIYPRIFTYSADYPEKSLIAGTRRNGLFPCPRCLIEKQQIRKMGTIPDRNFRNSHRRHNDQPTRSSIQAARSKIYDKGLAVQGDAVEAILKEKSLLPVETAFSKRLSRFQFDCYSMLVVDLLHEFELGVWRALFVHLIRILYAINASRVHELDRRYRLIPGFGGIRKFSKNVSELKKMAARDYEDLLQCAMPAFDGLFEEPHNKIIQNLLFLCARWHALAKLRMHTETTVDILKEVTTALGMAFRKFETTTCVAYTTHELPREVEARRRRAAKKSSKEGSARTGPEASSRPSEPSTAKTFNLATYKYHSLADYPDMIKLYGTSDSFSTESGELEHRTPKARYRRTDRRGYIKQMAQIERRQARLRRIHVAEHIAPDLAHHHTIGKSENIVEHIAIFLQRSMGDPAVTDFIPKLKKHLLPRIRSLLGLDPSDTGDWKRVIFHRDRMFLHKTMRVHFTTYDIRRADDVIHPRTKQSNILVLNPEFSPSLLDTRDINGHPFWYGTVLGIYHVNVIYIGEGNQDYQPRRLEFLWVRWYDLTSLGCWKTGRLDQLTFPSMRSENAFGFIDPSDVVRGCHLIPCFRADARHYTPDVSISSHAQDRHDCKTYIINRFVDRDMILRYHWGHGVGHVYASFQRRHSPTPEPIGGEVEIEDDHDTSDFSGSYEDMAHPTQWSDSEDGRSEHSFLDDGVDTDQGDDDDFDGELSD